MFAQPRAPRTADSPLFIPSDPAPLIADAILVLQARNPDSLPLDDDAREALGTLYLAFSYVVRATALRILSDSGDADDIVHDVFLGLPRAIQQYRHHGGFRGWLNRVAATQSLMFLRRRRRYTLQPVDALQDIIGGTSGDPLSDDGVDEALRSLPLPLREVAVLRFFAGFSHQRIAETLEISVTASEMRLFRAVTRLRQALRTELANNPRQALRTRAERSLNALRAGR